jgi:ATP-dependent RNA helicase DDX31/DBP7
LAPPNAFAPKSESKDSHKKSKPSAGAPITVNEQQADKLSSFFARQRELTGAQRPDKPPSMSSHSFYNGRPAPMNSKRPAATAAAAPSSAASPAAAVAAQPSGAKPMIPTSAVSRGGKNSGGKTAEIVNGKIVRRRPAPVAVQHAQIQLPSDEEYPSGSHFSSLICVVCLAEYDDIIVAELDDLMGNGDDDAESSSSSDEEPAASDSEDESERSEPEERAMDSDVEEALAETQKDAVAPVVLRRDKKAAARAAAAASGTTPVAAAPKPLMPKVSLKELDSKERAPAAKDSFGKDSWAELGLSERLVKHLETNMNKLRPTKVQALAIPKLLDGRDLLVQSPTGTGKTLSYVLPILQQLSSQPQRVTREDGTKALIIAPTRELCLQIYEVMEFSTKACVNLVPGIIIGGEKKKSEKARLRKGITLLVSTPGRLLDHLRTTECFKFDALRWLVFDEADRLLDMGFEQDIKGILAALNAKVWQRQAVLISATLRGGIRALADLFLHDPMFVYVGGGEQDANGEAGAEESKKRKQPDDDESEKEEGEEGTKTFDEIFAARQQQSATQFTVPKSLMQMYVECDLKMRLPALGALLRGKVEHAPNKHFKCIVFVSTCDSVDFHHSLYSHSYWPDDLPSRKKDDDDIKAMDSDDEPEVDANVERAPLIDVPLYRLHGNLPQAERTDTYFRFCKAEAGILFTTDVAARGLDLPALDCIVQFDAPEETTDYIHRVGRCSRMGRKGEAVIFLREEELGYLDVLRRYQINPQKMALLTVLSYLKVKGGPPRQSNAPLESVLQTQFQRIVASDTNITDLARYAYHSYCRAYAAYPKELKQIFHIRSLHLGHAARSFGLTATPSHLKPNEKDERKRNSAKSLAFQKWKRVNRYGAQDESEQNDSRGGSGGFRGRGGARGGSRGGFRGAFGGRGGARGGFQRK